MVAQWGFAFDELGGGPVAWETPEGNGLMQPKVASPDMEAQIDKQVQEIVTRAFENCMSTLTENKALLDAVTERLIEKETIDYDELLEMRDAHFGGASPAGLCCGCAQEDSSQVVEQHVVHGQHDAGDGPGAQQRHADPAPEGAQGVAR